MKMMTTASRRQARFRTVAMLAVAVSFPLAGALIPPSSANNVPVLCDHLMDVQLVEGVATVHADQKALYPAGDFLVSPDEPHLQFTGDANGDHWDRHVLIVVNGEPVGVEDENAPWYHQVDPENCPSFQYHTATVSSSFDFVIDLEDYLNPAERLLPVDVMVGVSTYEGSWELTVEST